MAFYKPGERFQICSVFLYTLYSDTSRFPLVEITQNASRLMVSLVEFVVLILLHEIVILMQSDLTVGIAVLSNA